MKTETVPLAVPSDLLREVRQAAKQTGLSMADAMRQSMKLGLPKLVADLSPSKVRPMTPAEARRAYANTEWDALEHAMVAGRQIREPEDD